MLKSDQERALGRVLKNLKAHGGNNTQTMLATSPVGASRASGIVERAVQTVEGQIGSLKLALEKRLGVKLPTAKLRNALAGRGCCQPLDDVRGEW